VNIPSVSIWNVADESTHRATRHSSGYREFNNFIVRKGVDTSTGKKVGRGHCAAENLQENGNRWRNKGDTIDCENKCCKIEPEVQIEQDVGTAYSSGSRCCGV
jgi:hypothetical protein